MVKNLSANAGDAREVCSIPGSGDPLGEEMATHSSILGWRIPWREQPGGLQSVASQRIVHNWSDLAHMHQAGDTGSIPGSGRSPGEGNSNPLQHSCLVNSMGREAFWAMSMGSQKSWTQLTN